MIEIIYNILTIGYRKSNSYYKLISEFRIKLPRPQNQAKRLSNKEIEESPISPDSFKHISVYDLSTLKLSMSEQELDMFFNAVQEFDFSCTLFKNYYKKHRANILKLKPTTSQRSVDWVVLQKVLQEDDIHPLKPNRVFIHHLKFEWKFTSRVYLKILQRKRYVHH
jgi:hypothetical protein